MAKLADAGFNRDAIEVYHASVMAGGIASQNPDPEDPLRGGAAVTITLEEPYL